MSFVSALFPIHVLGGQKSLLNHFLVCRCFLLVGGEGRGLVSLEVTSHTPPRKFTLWELGSGARLGSSSLRIKGLQTLEIVIHRRKCLLYSAYVRLKKSSDNTAPMCDALICSIPFYFVKTIANRDLLNGFFVPPMGQDPTV